MVQRKQGIRDKNQQVSESWEWKYDRVKQDMYVQNLCENRMKVNWWVHTVSCIWNEKGMCLNMLYTKMCSFGYMAVWIECYMRIKLIKLVKTKVSYVNDYMIENEMKYDLCELYRWNMICVMRTYGTGNEILWNVWNKSWKSKICNKIVLDNSNCITLKNH